MKLDQLPAKFDFKTVESGKAARWKAAELFVAGKDKSKNRTFTIVIPPPNITGILHLGHVWDNTIQDIIIRRKKMQGYDTLFLPGMDHASIATQAKIDAQLKKAGTSRYELGREKFMEVAWEWKREHAGIIAEQWQKLGLALDYTRERFTFDAALNKVVNHVFVKMYNEGLIYRGERIINWDVEAQTALSNIEVEYEEEQGSFYYIAYPLVSGAGAITIATTRPETMFADQALMVNPKDPRYAQLIGEKVRIPLTETEIPVLADEHADPALGTGAVKVTPAHDPNDFAVGERHGLAMPFCMDEAGFMLPIAGKYAGLERFACREALVRDLADAGFLVKTEPLVHAIGRSERTGVVVEPRLSKQWFVKMAPLAELVIEKQKDPATKVNFYPDRFENTLLHWMENIQDWCISRQLWWGHQIPAWYRGDEVYVGETQPAGDGWVQDEDALDTWFSSALWPFSTLGWPNDTADFARYYPTDCLVTGGDIIFFWVARMIFQAQYLTGTRPFQDAVIHGLIRDELGRKISKSLGNGVNLDDAVALYGTDALRFFIVTTGAPGQDIRFVPEKVQAAWNFINKVWNISRFIGLNCRDAHYTPGPIDRKLLKAHDLWILSRHDALLETFDYNFEKYDFGEAAKALYKFTWDEFASWYVELAKVVFAQASPAEQVNTCRILVYCLTTIVKLLAPFMPFVTEELYSYMAEGFIAEAAWPEPFGIEQDASGFAGVIEIVTALRNFRATKDLPKARKLPIICALRDPAFRPILTASLPFIDRFIHYESFEITSELPASDAELAVIVLETVTLVIPLAGLVDTAAEQAKLTAQKAQLVREIARARGLLNNPGFLNKAPAAKVAEEEAKLASFEEQLAAVSALLANLEK